MVGRGFCSAVGKRGERGSAPKILPVDSVAQESFSRRQRLLRAGDYARIFKSTEAMERNSCWVVLGRLNHTTRARLGLAIGRKRVRCAVQRNRIKRVVRESFRRQGTRLSGWDIVVIARGSTVVGTNAKLVASLEELWDRVSRKSGKQITILC